MNRILKKLFVFFILVGVVGCGDCESIIDPNTFIPNDVLPKDVPDFGPKTDVIDTSDMQTGDTISFPEDTGFNFDFGRPDQSELPFAITGVIPESGPISGGNLVRISGDSLLAETAIFMGSKRMEVELVGGSLVGRVPPGSGAGGITVKAIAPDGEIRALVDAYNYVEDLRIDSISPTLLPTIGGSEVEIRGAGFREPVGVSFSRVDALHVEFISPALIRAIVPPRPRGFADLRVTTLSESAEKIRAVEFYDEVHVERVEPASGIVAGGETVVIYGRGFTSTSTVNFDNESAEIISVDINQGRIVVKTPPHSVGLSDIFVSSSRSSGVLSDGFYYRADNNPILSKVLPDFGPTSGQNTVRLMGYRLDDANASFAFGGVEAVVIASDPTFVDVQVPSANAGVVDVMFSISNVEVNRLANAYTYVEDLVLTSLSPMSGPDIGGTIVTLRGQGFTGTSEVKFDGVATPFSIISDTEIAATTLSHPSGTVDVSVHRENLVSKQVDAFTFSSDLEIWGFTPTSGARAGGTFVEVRGTGFFGTLEVTLDGTPAENVQRLDRNNLVFYSPAHVVGEAIVKVKREADSVVGPYPYFYFEPASRFGGASGSQVDGSVNVTVFSSEGPLGDAFVMLSTRAETQYQGFTDANGQITLSGPGVVGAQTTTATAAGYSTATLQTVDAENITILLNKLNPTPGQGGGTAPPVASIFGTITAAGKLPDPEGQDTYNMNVVRTTQLSTAGAGFPNPGNNSIVIGQQGNFDIASRVGDLALIGLCGTFHEPSGVFTPEFLAIERFIFLGDKDRLEVDLICDIPLDQTHQYKITNGQFAPSGPDINRIDVFWDFGFEGVFESRVAGVGLGSIIEVGKQPETKGRVADMNFIASGGSFSGLGAPFTIASLLEIPDPSTLIELPTLLDVPHALRPLPGGTVVNNQISFAGGAPFEPDFYVGLLRNEFGVVVYQFFLPGDETTFVLPTFPDFSALAVDKRPVPLTQGPLFLTVVAAKMRAGHVYETLSYRDIDPSLWEAYSQNSWSVRLPLP